MNLSHMMTSSTEEHASERASEQESIGEQREAREPVSKGKQREASKQASKQECKREKLSKMSSVTQAMSSRNVDTGQPTDILPGLSLGQEIVIRVHV